MRVTRDKLVLLFSLLVIASPTLAGENEASLTTDEEQLLDLHRRVLQAHIDGDVDAWLANEAGEYVSANRGEITRPTLEERRERIVPYLASATFTVYRDTEPPIVRVSDDGTLGWVIARVEIRGTRTLDDGSEHRLDSIWTWIELYEKSDGRWVRVGNVSNRRPD